MASPTLEYLRSPFENVFQILPQGHDKALKQAFYNTAATLFAVVVCVAAVAVYHILEIFIRPLLWAVLAGTFLHPFKNTLTSILRRWLQTLRSTGTPLLLGTVLLPVQVVDGISENLGSVLVNSWKLISATSIGLPAVYLMYHIGLLSHIWGGVVATLYFMYDASGYFTALWVWSLVIAYTLTVAFFWTPRSSTILKPLAVPVWIALAFHLAALAGPLRVPLFFFIVVLIVVGFASEVNEARKKLKHSGGEEQTSPSALAIWRIWSSSNRADTGATFSPEGSPQPPPASSAPADTAAEPTPQASAALDETPHRPKSEDKAEEGNVGSGHEKRPKDLGSPTLDLGAEKKQRSLSDLCFIGLFWALIFARIWVHAWIVKLLPILFAVLLMKKLGAHLGSWVWLRKKITGLGKHIKNTICDDHRVDILAPGPVRGLGKLIIRGDRKIVASLEASMDKAMSILIVLLLLLATILGTFFIVVQVHKESMHLVSVTSNLLNKTLHPELTQWMPGNEEMHQTLDSMVANAYVYGREWIAVKLRSGLSGDDDSKRDVEKQVLEVWDRLYEMWFARNSSTTATQRYSSGHIGVALPDLTNMSSVWDVVTTAKNFNLDVVGFAKENVGVFLSVIESIWSVLKGNITLALNILTATLSLLFGGGTALLNFVLSLIVFITALFYLLASSGDQYKPVEWAVSLSPTQGSQGNKFGKAVEEAIGSVFLASLKMAAFYGLYTWLTHTVFGIQIVFIPSALAAIFAAIPFVGTYFAALPAVIELWLVNGQKVQAILLVVCHLLPMFFVDTAIYSEVKGGHPYMTGLAIAGGMYWMGLEGAIMGPILLCCLVVAVNMYSSMLKPDLAPMTPTAAKHQRVATLASDKKVTFNLQRGFSSPDALES